MQCQKFFKVFAQDRPAPQSPRRAGAWGKGPPAATPCAPASASGTAARVGAVTRHDRAIARWSKSAGCPACCRARRDLAGTPLSTPHPWPGAVQGCGRTVQRVFTAAQVVADSPVWLQQAAGVPTAEHFPNHRNTPAPDYGTVRRTCSAASSSRRITRIQNCAAGSKSSPRCPVAFNRPTA